MCTYGSTVRSLAMVLALVVGAWCSGGLGTRAMGQCQDRWLEGPEFPAQEPGSDGVIFCSCMWEPDGSGYQRERLIVGGAFATIGGVAANNIAMWDGTHWTAIGPGFNGVVI